MTMLRRPRAVLWAEAALLSILGYGSGKYGGRGTTPAVFGTERPRSQGAGPSTRALGNKDHACREAMLLRNLL